MRKILVDRSEADLVASYPWRPGNDVEAVPLKQCRLWLHALAFGYQLGSIASRTWLGVSRQLGNCSSKIVHRLIFTARMTALESTNRSLLVQSYFIIKTPLIGRNWLNKNDILRGQWLMSRTYTRWAQSTLIAERISGSQQKLPVAID